MNSFKNNLYLQIWNGYVAVGLRYTTIMLMFHIPLFVITIPIFFSIYYFDSSAPKLTGDEILLMCAFLEFPWIFLLVLINCKIFDSDLRKHGSSWKEFYHFILNGEAEKEASNE